MADCRPKEDVKAYSRCEAAYVLGVHVNTIDNLTKRGELEAVKLGSRVLYPVAAVDRLLAGAA
jgi:excisionase family DNA binding protein